jgi:hypothetical protein
MKAGVPVRTCVLCLLAAAAFPPVYGAKGPGRLPVRSPSDAGAVAGATDAGTPRGSIVGWGWQVVGVDLSSGFVQIAAGFFYSLGLKADGSIVGWGSNAWGQVNAPAPNTDFIAVAAGGAHSLGLKADGSIVAWGAGGPRLSGFPHYGQSIVPAPNADFIAVAAGEPPRWDLHPLRRSRSLTQGTERNSLIATRSVPQSGTHCVKDVSPSPRQLRDRLEREDYSENGELPGLLSRASVELDELLPKHPALRVAS